MLDCVPQTVARQAPPSMGILQARKLEWVAMPSSRASSHPRPRTPALQADSLPSEPPGKPHLFWISFPSGHYRVLNRFPVLYSRFSLVIYFIHACMEAKGLQSCPALCDPMDCSPQGSSVHWIFQARTLEWVATPSSRGSSLPRDQICIAYASCIGRQVLYQQHHLGNPFYA